MYQKVRNFFQLFDGLRNLSTHQHYSAFIFLATLSSYYIIWAFANWSALITQWWFLDDYAILGDTYPILLQGLINGRPIEGLFFLLQKQELNFQSYHLNILFRLFQGLIHCTSATLIAHLLWRKYNHYFYLLAGIPFLLWPFNGEAVLWRTAIGYPVGALLSISGIYLILSAHERQKLRLFVAFCLLVGSILSNQAAAFAGLTVWFLLSTLRILDRIAIKQFIWELKYIVPAYFISSLISYFLIENFGAWTGRSTISLNILENLYFLKELNMLFISWPSFYPNWLTAIHILMAIIPVLLISELAFRKIIPFNLALIATLFYLTLFIVPYSAAIIVQENWAAFRIFYIAPLFLCGSWAIITYVFNQLRLPTIFPLTFLAILVFLYISIAQVNSFEYVQLYKFDRKTLNRIEEKAQIWNQENFYLVTFPELKDVDWNPYNMHYLHADAKLSAFIRSYSGISLVNIFSDLQLKDDTETKSICLEFCTTISDDEPISFGIPSNQDVICICPK